MGGCEHTVKKNLVDDDDDDDDEEDDDDDEDDTVADDDVNDHVSQWAPRRNESNLIGPTYRDGFGISVLN